MEQCNEYQKYLEHLCSALGHADRKTGFLDYCHGLMLPIERKSIEPLAAHTDPMHVQAKHQSLHHFVANSKWSDQAILEQVQSWAMPSLEPEHEAYLIIDDSSIPKKGKHSVGTARQYCGRLGKHENCQVAVSLSLATAIGSIPLAYKLYLPKEWIEDKTRCEKAGVPDTITFQTKPDIALEQIRKAKSLNIHASIVLADAGYGDITYFRDEISKLNLQYVVGVKPQTAVWEGANLSILSREWTGKGHKSTRLLRASGHKPQSVKAIAKKLSQNEFRKISWREGTNYKLESRFARLRVRSAHEDNQRVTMRDEEWLLIEWPENEVEPVKYWLATLSPEISFKKMVYIVKMRWRIERDYEELKQEFGLAQYEGRNWRGFHHHGTLCIAAYAFLMVQRLRQDVSKKKLYKPKTAILPKDYKPRGSRESCKACA